MKTEFHVVVLPGGEPVASHCTLGEALAFLRGYHEVVSHGERKAVIATEPEGAVLRTKMLTRAPSKRARRASPALCCA
jgi:hypothetical protein